MEDPNLLPKDAALAFEKANLVLEYFRVFLSAPVIFGVVIVVVVFLFKSDIKNLIGRIATIKLGGSELSMSQQARSTEETSSPRVPDVPPDEQVPTLGDINFNEEQLTAVRELYLGERANAYLWEYRYLNLFFVETTQFVLEWIAGRQEAISVSFFDNLLTPSIRSAEEREAIIVALQSHRLIVVSDGLIKITPKGQEYIEWRGSLNQNRA